MEHLDKKIILGIIILSLIGFSNAQEIEACCMERNDGAICELATASNCVGIFTGVATCEGVAGCEVGCCIESSGEGTCALGTRRNVCDANGGTWKSGANCEINECQNICCIVGDESYFVNPTECNFIGISRGVIPEIENSITQGQCKSEAELIARGACVVEGTVGNQCSILTGSECLAAQGSFFEGYLCTHPTTGTNYQKQVGKTCVQGKDEVYWEDSKGNIGNIWSSDPDTSWNNGEFLSKERSCNPTSSNIESSTCGNCNEELGSTCGYIDGEAMCIDLGCKDAPATIGTQDRKNGETWCIYESIVGLGKDVPGSSHYVASCVKGEVSVKSCDLGQSSSGRTGVCIQKELDVAGGTTSTASCKLYDAPGCLEINSGIGDREGQDRLKAIEEVRNTCESTFGCYLGIYNFGTNEQGIYCLPQFPLGFTQNPTESEANKIEEYCSVADFKCTKIIMRRNRFASWHCVQGCECDKARFVKEMNDMCSSIGDCGASSNVFGEITRGGFDIKTPSAVSLSYLNNIDAYIDRLNELSIPGDYYISYEVSEEDPDFGYYVAVRNGETYRLDSLVLELFWSNIAVNYSEFMENYENSLTTEDLWEDEISWEMDVGAFTNPFIFYDNIAGNTIINDLMPWMTEVNRIVGNALDEVLDWIGLGGSTREYVYKFECQPWEAPGGGEKCSECNNGPDGSEGCTKYKCESLGKLCDYVEENRVYSEDVCLSLQDNNKAPTITPWEEALSEGYRFEVQDVYEVKLRTDSGNCLPLNKDITIGIKTDEHAQCQIFEGESPESPVYEDLTGGDYFAGFNGYILEHKRNLTLNHAQSIFRELLIALENDEINTVEQYDAKIAELNEDVNEYNYYVRCNDRSDESDPHDYVIQTCIAGGSTDNLEPIILNLDELNSQFVSFDATEKVIEFIIDEPAICKWDREPFKPFDEMVNSMWCSTNWGAKDNGGWPCRAKFDNLSVGENNFYIKCRDQPWLDDFGRVEQRNTGEDKQFNLNKYSDKIQIVSIYPDSNFEIGEKVTSVELQVQTIGGGTEHTCLFSARSALGVSQMWTTGSRGTHTQPGLQLASGDNTIYIKCFDETGDYVQAQSSFRIEYDDVPSQISRVWENAGTLHVITTEAGECKYSKEGCDFQWEDGISAGIGTKHTINTIRGETYYIKCKDEFDNVPVGCSIQVHVP